MLCSGVYNIRDSLCERGTRRISWLTIAVRSAWRLRMHEIETSVHARLVASEVGRAAVNLHRCLTYCKGATEPWLSVCGARLEYSISAAILADMFASLSAIVCSSCRCAEPASVSAAERRP